MGFLGWMAAVGGLLLLMSLATGWIRPLPVTHFALYLAVGAAVGPWGLDLLNVDFLRDAAWMERLTEVALIISLFVGGLKLRVPLDAGPAAMARRLAFPAMFLGIAGMTLAARLLLGLDWPVALILAAMLAPTDPVLASVIAVDNAADRDGLRVALSGEAGMNDGSAMPFLLLGLTLLATPWSWGLFGHWALLELVWGVVGGLGIGFAMGWGIGWLSTRLMLIQRDPGPSALLTLGLIALTYAAAQSVGALGFLAAFAAGAGMRMVEVGVVREHPHPRLRRRERDEPLPAEFVAGPPVVGREDRGEPVQAVGRLMSDALVFGDTMEHLLAPLLVLLLGIAVARHWDIDGVGMAAVLFFVVRPLAVWLVTLGSGWPWQRRLMVGWLGIRGIGGINYLCYAITHGVAGAQAGHLAGIVVTVTALSTVVHGFSAQPLLAWRRRRAGRG
ncbi:MAG TPA: cation:proton antiporter [Frateuria sp.]|uniref:cation:proton antiporter n=1 Tax=Frateuria sp. TaxID=2211372 RepID=UPI002D7F0A75|nr:cation:proton antiporter [Frateuria sp.]HET6806170.1 cation:proton antiporter [Frateuria sp.]